MRAILALSLLSLLLSACTPRPQGDTEAVSGPQEPLPSMQLVLEGPAGEKVPVVAEIADDEAEREAGMMYRTSMPAGTGMLFVFSEAQRLSFWMKNTLIPLDMLFFHKGQLIAVIPWAKPHDETPLGPQEVADKVLEVPGGWAALQGVGVGWKMSMQELGTRN